MKETLTSDLHLSPNERAWRKFKANCDPVPYTWDDPVYKLAWQAGVKHGIELVFENVKWDLEQKADGVNPDD